MRKFTLILVAVLLAVFTLTPLSAQDATPDIFAGASMVPATDQVYMSFRIDEAYLGTLNDLVSLVANAAVEMGAPINLADIPRLQDLIAKQVDPNATPEQVDAVLNWVGDTVTISGDLLGDAQSQDIFNVFVPISDKQAALDAINVMGAGLRGVGTAGRFMIYQSDRDAQTSLLLADDLLILTNGDANLLGSGDYAKLSETPAFAAVVAELPADSYNIAFFMGAEAVNDSADMAGVFSGDILIGATILDGKTLTLDAVALPTTPAAPSQAVNPDFLRYIPADTTAFIHATDLSNLLNSAIALGEAQGNASARAEFEQALLSIDLTLDDLLTWTKGDYALFARADLPALLQAVTTENIEGLAPAVDFGVVIEAADPALAKQFSDKIAGILASAVASQPGVVMVTKEINGTTVTRIEINAPVGNGQSLNFALGLGANQNVFVFGTYRAVETILTDTSGLSSNPLYAESSAYVLPNATSVWYTDSTTLTSVVGLGVFGAFGSSAGGVFEDIYQEFNFGRETAARAQTIQNDDEMTMILKAIDRFSRLVRHATASSTVSANGAYVLRATLTLGE